MSNRKMLWAFAGAVALQLAVLAAVPAPQAYTRLTGRTVILKTAPVDPYDVMSGYYVTLSYEISDRNRIPGEKAFLSKEKATGNESVTVYVVLREGADGVWAAESVHDAWPDVPADRVVVKGLYRYWMPMEFGIERFFIPETAREAVEKDLRANRDGARVEVKIDSFGRAALMRLRIGDRVYDY
ncbi:MAG: GDYXXLXY domain-containing protein [Planctomycetota bacterium]|nr:GDYXXLXY domain-containing protein [Planctomycetota bacterium]